MSNARKIAKRTALGGIILFGVGFALAVVIAILIKDAVLPALGIIVTSLGGLFYEIWQFIKAAMGW